MSAAVCEMDCGVLAVGRCFSCGRAFCASHQARNHTGFFVDWCVGCKATDDRSRVEAPGLVVRANAEAVRLFRSGQAAEMLRAAQVPMDDLYTVTRYRKRLFSSVQIPVPEPAGQAWILRNATWTFTTFVTREGNETVTDEWLTALYEDPERGHRGLVRVSQDPNIPGYKPIEGGRFTDGWPELAARVRELAGQA